MLAPTCCTMYNQNKGECKEYWQQLTTAKPGRKLSGRSQDKRAGQRVSCRVIRFLFRHELIYRQDMQAIDCKYVAAHTKDMTLLVGGKQIWGRGSSKSPGDRKLAWVHSGAEVFNVGDTTLINRNEGWKTKADAWMGNQRHGHRWLLLLHRGGCITSAEHGSSSPPQRDKTAANGPVFGRWDPCADFSISGFGCHGCVHRARLSFPRQPGKPFHPCTHIIVVANGWPQWFIVLKLKQYWTRASNLKWLLFIKQMSSNRFWSNLTGLKAK